MEPSPPVSSLLAQAVDLHLAGSLEQAEAQYRRVLAADAEHFQAHGNLGHLLTRLGRAGEALHHYERAVAINPDYALGHNNLGVALREAGRTDEAAACFVRAVAADRTCAPARYNLAQVLAQRGLIDEALLHYQAAMQLQPALAGRPDHAMLENNLGVALMGRGQIGPALAHLRRSLDSDPRAVVALRNLGALLLRTGQLREAVRCYEHVRALVSDPRAGSLLLLLSHYDDELCSPEQAFRAHLQWADRHEAPLQPPAPRALPPDDPERPLRVGYVSSSFCQHAVARFLEPLLSAHDRRRYTIIGYADQGHADATTARMRGLCDEWREVHGRDDEALCRLVRADGVDILVDTGGHTDGSRLLAFARRPAPVQVTYLGYPGTTGLGSIGYRVTDAWADPPGDIENEALYTERLVRLPHGFNCYQPSADAPAPRPAPVLQAGAPTFGSFNVLAKLTPRVVAAWAEILLRAPGARLLLKTEALSDPGDLAPSDREHLQAYHEVDLALDPFPYNGTTTTCDALYMGVPVLVLAGRTHAARVGVSLLSRAGLPECIAGSVEDYVGRAVRLAADLPWLAATREGLRQRSAPLRDAALVTGELEVAYRQMWRARCGVSGSS